MCVVGEPSTCLAHSRCSVNTSSSLPFPTYWGRRGADSGGVGEKKVRGWGRTQPSLGGSSCWPGRGAVSSPGGAGKGQGLGSARGRGYVRSGEFVEGHGCVEEEWEIRNRK